jgi:asparagine synthase (glutamine-hydrolysing)
VFRFLAFAWQNPDEDRAGEIRRRVDEAVASEGRTWSPAYRARGLEVWHAEDRPGRMESVRLPDGGVLLGRTLSRTDGYPDWTPSPLTKAASSLDPVKKAEWLFENIWGSYVGFFPQQHEYPPAVFRDPSGGLPCYRVRWNDFDVFTSNIEVLRGFPGLRFSVDLGALTVHVLLPLVSKCDTGLKQVTEVLPGECLCLSRQEARKFLWDPIALSQNSLRIDATGAAQLMRDRLIEVTDALVRPYRTVLHNLGGLDSSILLTCLTAARSAPEITCVNFYTSAFSGDERRYARKMSAHAGVPLIERRLEPDRVDLDIWRAQEMGPSPPAMFDSLTLAGDVHGLADELAVDALSYGTGGDSVFFQAPYIFSALDYVATKAPAGKLARTALEAAQYGGRSLASTVIEMVRERLWPRHCFDTIIELLDPGYLINYLAAAPPAGWQTPDHLHPMLKPDESFPKGKYYQIIASSFFNLESHRYRFPRRREFDYICPLLAQPFVELCLQIPTWQLAYGGVSRGLARRAFWKDLPREISGRTSKSSSEGVYEQMYARNYPVLREALLDGYLVRAGFFSRERLETALSEHRDQLVATDPAMFFDLYALEIWASRWSY